MIRLEKAARFRYVALPMERKLSAKFIGIRRFHPDDVPSLFAAARESLDELAAWMVWCHAGYSLTDSMAFVSSCEPDWENGKCYNFAICDLRDGAFLGSVGLNHVNRSHGFANLGYWVRTTRAGQGIASAATRQAAEFALQKCGFHRLEIVVPSGNKPSQRVAEKAGAKLEGILRQRIMLQGRPHDAALYSLIKQDLINFPPQGH
jgi:ribosomal-protein-serine acetyltransferase